MKSFKVNDTTIAQFHNTGHVSITQADPIGGKKQEHVLLEVGELQAIVTNYFVQREDA